MIEVRDLTRRYGGTTAVDDVSFSIGRGEIVGLLGHNGAGKTTIMRMLSGYLEPSAGSIAINGLSLASHAHIIQQQLGYLPENLPVYPDMMVADYLDYVATLKGVGSAERAASIKAVLVATDLTGRALEPVRNLSRGLKQRVGVAQAILGRPGLLILDEPTNGLDPHQTAHMRELIRQIARRATVILSTHIMQEVDAVCDRVLVLRNGRLALDRRLSELRESRSLLLRTDAMTEQLAADLRDVPQVAALDQSAPADGPARCQILLHDAVDMDLAASAIASVVMQSGGRLYQLAPVSRDLDTVFREATADGA